MSVGTKYVGINAPSIGCNRFFALSKRRELTLLLRDRVPVRPKPVRDKVPVGPGRIGEYQPGVPLHRATAGEQYARAVASNVPSDADVREFERLLRECHREVYQVAFGVLRGCADAEEITQDAFLRAYRKLSSLREPQKFRSWVARMSFRLALNRRRSIERSRRRDTSWLETSVPSTGDVETIVAGHEFKFRLQQEIDRLPKKLRGVLLLSAVQELNTRDIAGVLGIPEGTVRSRLHLARKKLLEVFCNENL